MIVTAAVLLAFIAGFASGALAAEWRSKRRQPERTPPMPNRPVSRGAAFVVVVLLALGLLITGLGAGVSWFRAADALKQARHTTEQLIDYSTCQARYQQRFAQIYGARIEPTAEFFDALDLVFFAVLGEDRNDFSTSLQHYVDVRERQKKALRQNPPPPLPKKVCGLPPEVDQ